MKKLYILLCGALDIENYTLAFDNTIEDFNCIPSHFINGSSAHKNNRSWAENSKDSVLKADIIVYLITERYGEITWNVEYNEAVLMGKPFILLCSKNIFDTYNTISKSKMKHTKDNSELSKIFKVIEELNKQERTIVPFDKGDKKDFERVLKNEISNIFYDGIQLLKLKNNNLRIIDAIKNDELSYTTNYKLT